MSAKFAKTETNKVERLDSQHVVVTVTSGPSKNKSYTLFVGKFTGVGNCTCSWGRRNGTTCSHVRDVEAFIAAEQAPKTESKESGFEKWLKEAQESGDIIFAS